MYFESCLSISYPEEEACDVKKLKDVTQKQIKFLLTATFKTLLLLVFYTGDHFHENIQL